MRTGVPCNEYRFSLWELTYSKPYRVWVCSACKNPLTDFYTSECLTICKSPLEIFHMVLTLDPWCLTDLIIKDFLKVSRRISNWSDPITPKQRLMIRRLENQTAEILPDGTSKVHIFWEGHKILRNLRRRFVLCSASQIYSGDFAKFYGLLRIYELYYILLHKMHHDTSVHYVLIILCFHKHYQAAYLATGSPWLMRLLSGSFLWCQLMIANYHVKKFVRNSQQS